MGAVVRPSFARWQQTRGIAPWTVVHATSPIGASFEHLSLGFEAATAGMERFVALMNTKLAPVIRSFDAQAKRHAEWMDAQRGAAVNHWHGHAVDVAVGDAL